MNIRLSLPIVFAFAFPNLVMPVQAQVVPGTGQQIVEVFDDFEDPAWSFTLNLPKSSANIDKVERHPSGFASNRLFLESMYRGTPDFVRRIDAPAGGIAGSKGALAMQTLNSGIPGQLSYTFQQDDLIAGVQQKLGYMMPVSWTPSYVCRIYVPPFEKWEQRHGSHFGFRADCTTTISKPSSIGRFFKSMGSTKKLEQYWPGFFIQLNLKHMSGQKEDSAVILIRSDQTGHDVPGPKITHAGWWTLGMTLTPDGKVHYYGHEGVDDLTAKDHLYSNFPYGYRCEQTSTYFFNIVNQDDGRSWSTRWIVDDPKVYVASGTYRPSIPQQVAQKLPSTNPPQAPVAKPTQPAVAAESASANAVAIPPAPPATAVVLRLTIPALPVPKLASKPTELPPVVPKTEPSLANPVSVPATLSESTLESPSSPATSSTIEEEPAPETPPSLEASPSPETPASPAPAIPE